ncbi:unnamed protein product [Rhizophagus irregularis]|nr:unnamed protein product [Rhizophagus irregularis]CAB5384564.1 unnamed protein product [Rhizophagus irregularis]
MSTQILTKKINLENDLKEHISIKDSISQNFPNRIVHAISVDYDETPTNNQSVLEHTMTSHGLAAAIYHAYNNHQHLLLTPDDIWLTIAQGVSQHINYNVEKFRYRFVKHKDKEEIAICIDECDFSTTTKNSLTASRIVLLDMLKEYFTYKGYSRCGIPKVTLEGTLEDWIKLQEKVIQLRQLDLDMDFWLDRLDPVVWKLVETYKGNVDEEFWSKIISKDSFGSGPSWVTGWTTALYPYRMDGEKLERDTINPDYIPDGRVEVPFTTDTGFCLKLVSGFLGAQQKSLEDSDELVVSPVIGWFVIDDETANKDKTK